MQVFEADAVALVTGGSRGIGRATCFELAAAGAHVVVAFSSNEEKAIEVVKTIEEAGGSASSAHADVADEGQVRSMFTDVKHRFGRLDVLVCNAGRVDDGWLQTMSTRKFQSVLDVNLLGTFFCCREAARMMAARRKGSIVTVSSATGAVGNPGQANYSASKGAIISFTKALAAEQAERGIRANVVAPGLIATEMVRGVPKDIQRAYVDRIPMKRPGGPEEVAKVIRFLASDESSYCTGAVFTVDGGLVR